MYPRQLPENRLFWSARAFSSEAKLKPASGLPLGLPWAHPRVGAKSPRRRRVGTKQQALEDAPMNLANLAELNKVATAMVTPGKGILAADESSGTIKKRFDAIQVESTEESRRDYREMLFGSTEAMSKYISGAILYDETICQNA